MNENPSAKRILVIAPHPDDETLGVGGTLLKHKDQGDSLHWMVMTQTYEPRWDGATIKAKAAEVEKAREAYPMDSLTHLGFDSGRLAEVSFAEIMTAMEQAIRKIQPHTVYVCHGGDVHTDHQITFQVTMSVLKPFKLHDLGVSRVLCYETMSSTEAAAPQQPSFIPTVYSDITGYLERKLAIMEGYTSEIQPENLPRGLTALEALARYRGAAINVTHAEAFMLVREVC